MNANVIVCPPWHFLPGPYEGDEERTGCPNRGTHDQQRKVYDIAASATPTGANDG